MTKLNVAFRNYANSAYKLFQSVHNIHKVHSAQSVPSSVVVFLLTCPIILLCRSDFGSLLHFRLQMKGKAVPLQAWTGPQGSRKLRFSDFVTTAQDGGRLSALRNGRLYPQEKLLVTHFCQRLSRPQGQRPIGRILCQWKNPLTPAGIERVTFWFVAQHLNHCATSPAGRNWNLHMKFSSNRTVRINSLWGTHH